MPQPSVIDELFASLEQTRIDRETVEALIASGPAWQLIRRYAVNSRNQATRVFRSGDVEVTAIAHCVNFAEAYAIAEVRFQGRPVYVAPEVALALVKQVQA